MISRLTPFTTRRCVLKLANHQMGNISMDLLVNLLNVLFSFVQNAQLLVIARNAKIQTQP
jgi:hypothetical protein